MRMGKSTFCIKGSPNPQLNRPNKERFERGVGWESEEDEHTGGGEKK
jgi:hypothetical protein